MSPLLPSQPSSAAAKAGPWDAVRYGPPVFAPLLFVDLAALAALGLWDLGAKLLPSPPA
jgi:hypothetical protein